jgi:hypothetical protein
MPFYFRKSITIGGIRLNFSKSGISYSSSPIKGFRITTGARGTYATVGSHGFYYRERLDKPKEQQPRPSAPPRQGRGPIPATPQSGDSIPTGDVSNFVDATSERMINEINSRKSKMRTAPIMGGICGLVSLLLLGNGFATMGALALIATMVATILAAHYDKTQRTTSLHYDLGNDVSKIAERKRICEMLSRSIKVWRVNTQQVTSDWKRNARATSLVGRKEVVIGKGLPPCIETGRVKGCESFVEIAIGLPGQVLFR